MSIYKHLLETEKYINSIPAVFIRDVEKFLSALPESLKSDSVVAQNFFEAKKLSSSMLSEQVALTELLSLCKKDVTYQNLTSLKAHLRDTYKPKYYRLVGCISRIYQSMSERNEANQLNAEAKIAYKNYSTNESYMGDFLDRISKILESDIAVLSAVKGDSQSLLSLYRSKLVRTVKINNKKVNIIIIGKFGRAISIIINDMKNECRKLLSKSDIDENTETNLLKIKESNKRKIEEKILEIFFNTFVEVLSNYPDLMRSSTVNFHIDLLSMRALGQFNSDSDFRDIHLRFDVRFVESRVFPYYLLGKKCLSSNDELYESIIHELTHAYDYEESQAYELGKQTPVNEYAYAKEFANGNEPS
jgi:hypothetical protein